MSSVIHEIKKRNDHDNDHDHEDEDDRGHDDDSENEKEIEDEIEEDEEDEEEEEEDDEDDDEEVEVAVDLPAGTLDDTDQNEEDSDHDREDELSEASDNEDEYKKLENYSVIENLENDHPEIRSINFEEVVALSRVQRDSAGNIIDPLHMSIPFLTKYEKARIIGARAEQIDRGAIPFVRVDENVMNGRTIALMEFEEKKIPFIIARPMPNKSVEYWKLQDLEFI